MEFTQHRGKIDRKNAKLKGRSVRKGIEGDMQQIIALLDALRPLGVKHIEMPATSERV